MEFGKFYTIKTNKVKEFDSSREILSHAIHRSKYEIKARWP